MESLLRTATVWYDESQSTIRNNETHVGANKGKPIKTVCGGVQYIAWPTNIKGIISTCTVLIKRTRKPRQYRKYR